VRDRRPGISNPGCLKRGVEALLSVGYRPVTAQTEREKKSPQTLRLAGLNPIQGELEETGAL
jgi:hypothetical protein